MKNFKFNFKSIVRSKARWLLTLIAILTLGVGQMWADNAGMYQGDLTYSYNGTTYTVNTGTTSTDLSTPLNATLKVTKVKFYFWYMSGDYSRWGNVCGGLLGYNLTGGDCSSEYLMGSEASWNDDGWVSDSRHKQMTITRDLTIASPTSASGNYTFNYYFKGWGDNDDGEHCGDNWYLSNNSSNYALNYKVRPPEVNGGDFTITSTDSQGGTGADSDHPMLITNGLSTTRFTVTASKAHADANSLLWVSFDNGSNWSTGANATATTVISGSKSVSSDVSSFTVKVKFRNNGAGLESATTVSKTFYYKEQPAGITVNAGSNGKVSIDNSNWSTSESIEDISLNTWYDIYAQGNTHYDFSSWSKGTNSSNITLEGSTAHTRIKIASGAVSSVTANFVEHPYTITIVNGTAASTTAKIATYGQATKSEPNGKYFTGWTVPGSNFTLTGGTKTSDATIKFFATANGMVTANMTPIWYLKGAFNDWGTTHPFVFTSATSGYVDVELSANSNFKVYDAQHSQMYGSQYGIENGTRLSTTLWGDNDNVCPINIQSIAGTYRFTLDISGTYPVIAVTLPVVNQVRISSASPTDATNTGNFNLTDQGSNNWSVQRRLNANTTYTFKIVSATTWYGKNSTAITRDNASAYSLSTSGANMTVRTDAAGNYTFNFNSSSKDLSVSYPTIYAITLKTKSFYNESATGTVDSNGGTVSAVDNYGATIADGGKVQTGGTVTFTATPKTGYTFEGWYNDADCAEGHKYVDNNTTINISGDDDEVLELSSITAAKTVYAKFSEKMTTVTLNSTAGGHITIGGSTVTETTAGVTTTRTIVAVPDAGYYFAGWTVADGSDCAVTSTAGRNDNESGSTTLRGLGAGTTGTVTANFVECEKIYFRNIFDDGKGNVSRWSDVYVHFDISWADYSGKQAVKTSVDNSTKGLHVAMTQIGSSDVYWAYVPRYITANSKAKVAFADHEDTHDDSYLWEGNAAGRGDYNPLLNMFVPHHTKLYSTNNVDYYSNGYWMKYDTEASQGAGYYLKKYKSQGNYWQPGEFIANTDDATTIQFKVRLDNVTTDSTRFMIVSAGGLNYLAASTPTSTACSDIELNEDTRSTSDNTVYFQLTASSEGYYTFIIDQTGDKMKLTVEYPVSPGDYRLVHTYTGRNIANTADSTYTTYSDVIKSSNAANATTLSMYLNSASTSLVLQNCTEINSTTKLPTWSKGDATNLSAITTAVGTNSGVYQFDVTVNTSTNQVSAVNHIGLYTGNYYIKTDCATGGWVNYTQNAMEKNTINATAAGYDYYYCKWIGNTTTNVKCVIANDYCNQLSDTLETDAILTRNNIAYQHLPYAASVRFSYNSATNTINRTYLLGSSDATSFLRLKPAEAGYVYTTSDGSTDLYTTDTKFQDNGNWTYQMDAYVYPGAKGGVYTDYPNSTPITRQELVDTVNNVLMGGTKPGSDPVRYHVRLVFDFKTDYLMSSYMPDGSPVTTPIDLQTDMMYVRSGEGASTQLSFSGSGKLENVKRAYGVFEFPKDQMSGQMSSWAANSYRAYKYCRYYFSFPFDVNIKDIFGVGEYGKEFIIQTYNGVKRAQIGWFMETDSFWETMDVNETLKANTGYSLMLDREEFNRSDGKGVWTNIADGKAIYLFFPSTSTTLGTIDAASGTFTVEGHAHTSGRTWTKDAKTLNHDETDSNWGMIGLPAYASTYPNNGTKTLDKCYTYQPDGNTWQVTNLVQGSSLLKSMHAYMVQYAGTFSWTTVAPSPIAARTLDTNTNMTIRLNLQYNGEEADRAFVKLQDGSDKGFVLNEDLYKMVNKGKTNIYVYAGDYDVAYSTTPVESQTIEVGVIIAKKGTYTFSMPEGINGTVTLIDTYTQTRTNLALEDYEVYLNKGTINDRFLLEIDVQHATTDVVTVSGDWLEESGIRKFIYDNQLYIMKNGVIYDARGNRVK